jgi:hypothetical protein
MVLLAGEHGMDGVTGITEAVPVGIPLSGLMTKLTPVAVLVARLVTVPVTVISPPLRTDWEAQMVVHVAESDTMRDGVPCPTTVVVEAV